MILEAYGFIVLFRFGGIGKQLYAVLSLFTCLKLMIAYTLQWFLAYISCLLAEDSYSWLVVSTTICSIGMFKC